MGSLSDEASSPKHKEQTTLTLKNFLETEQAPMARLRDKNYRTLVANRIWKPKAKTKTVRAVSRFVHNEPASQSVSTAVRLIPNASVRHSSQNKRWNFLCCSRMINTALDTKAGACRIRASGSSGPLSGSGRTSPIWNGSFLQPQMNDTFCLLPLPPEVPLRLSVSDSLSSCSTASPSLAVPSSPVSSVCFTVEASLTRVLFSGYSSEPKPLPAPPNNRSSLREFSFEELERACHNFHRDFRIRDGDVAGPVYRGTVETNFNNEKVNVDVTRFVSASSHSLKKWRAQVNSLARMAHPHLCKIVGFCSENAIRKDGSAEYIKERLLVYETAANGGLDGLLYKRTDRDPLDWPNRIRIALGTCQGLAYLHERTSKKIIYKNFNTSNIQVDENFNAKLSDYGFSGIPSRQHSVDNLSTLNSRQVTSASPKKDICIENNVWSFGIVLLELLTGRQHVADIFRTDERSILQWAKEDLMDDKILHQVMDPELKGQYSIKGAAIVADLALQCLEDDPSRRPSLRTVIDILKSVQATGTMSSTISAKRTSWKSKRFNAHSLRNCWSFISHSYALLKQSQQSRTSKPVYSSAICTARLSVATCGCNSL